MLRACCAVLCFTLTLLPSEGLAVVEQSKTFRPRQAVDGSGSQHRAQSQLSSSESCLLSETERGPEHLLTQCAQGPLVGNGSYAADLNSKSGNIGPCLTNAQMNDAYQAGLGLGE